MTFSDLAKKAQKFTIDNSPTIFTVIGATGVVATAYLTGKASFKAAGVIRDAQLKAALRKDVAIHKNDLDPQHLDFKEKVNLTWKLYVPAFAVGAVTLTSVVGANKIGTKRTAALATAYSLSQTAFEDYRSKVVEKLGDKKSEQIIDEVAQDRVNANPISTREVIVTGNGVVDCYDVYSGRYFKSSAEEIKAAENRLNWVVNNQMYASLNEFYDFLGLPRIDAGEEVGWTSDKLLELTISATLSDQMTPCLAVTFAVKPVRDYFRLGR